MSIPVDTKVKLIQAALDARDAAYCPYSKFRVGAALLSADGQIIKGCNVENASYGGAICAERTAMVKAVSDGIKSFTALAVATDVEAPISPCGICRQFIREFCKPSMPIYMASAKWTPKDVNASEPLLLEQTVGQILPHSFGPEDLEKVA
ncbi:cytidine deaminase [Sistotremastrum suecicum HHB10207 ss-3]|uniref:Cytidine deaminase n=1 Tax=Sistotremastrum suecicum HHB10207 ss-3 TaxID=1314776 RepID=A0A166BY45_9AGAM|nr:cytidine deaminase [Sistotremastrum suecicum HHB10207 ss-3]